MAPVSRQEFIFSEIDRQNHDGQIYLSRVAVPLHNIRKASVTFLVQQSVTLGGRAS